MRFKVLLITLILTILTSYGQTDFPELNRFIERYIENTEDEIDIQQFATDLSYFYINPLDLNKASLQDLLQLPFISPFQALEIVEHRNKFGDYLSIYELQVLNSFSVDEIRDLLFFATLNKNTVSLHFKDLVANGKHQIISLFETQRPRNKGQLIRDTIGDESDKNYYLGSSIYSNFRYRYDYRKNLSFGLNAEKDAGETFLGPYNKQGFDYYSAYVSLTDIGRISTLNIGDFQANFGQGLTLSTGLAFGKSSIITNAKRNFTGYSAYRSLRENAQLRGVSTTLKLGEFSIGTFASRKKLDANMLNAQDTLDPEISFVTSITEDGGFHRTFSELEDKDAIIDNQLGLSLSYNLKRGQIGAVSTYRQFSAALSPNTLPYNAFSFTGTSYSKTGLYYDLVWRNINLFGETSLQSHQSAIATVNGALISLGRNLDLSLVYRNYPSAFISYQSNAFGESSNNQNETGFYAGFTAKLNKDFRLLGYYDLYQHHWLRFRTDAPSYGNDIWLELNYSPSKAFNAYYRFRTETKQENSNSTEVGQIVESTITRHRIHAKLKLTKHLELRNRAEWNTFSSDQTKSLGSYLYQDLVFNNQRGNWQCVARAAIGSIDEFENRIYSFENVPLYDYPLFTMTRSGFRSYLLIRYKASRNLNFWIRYGITKNPTDITSLNQNDTFGSGLNEVEGNHRNTFTFQLRYKI